MAKRRKKTKKIRTFRRKSSMGAIDFTNVLGVVAGSVVASYLDKVIPDTIDNKIVGAGKIALGVALPMFVKSGNMKNILGGAGAGMIAVGSVDLLKEFGVLGAVEEDDMLEVTLNGETEVLAGDEDISVINGDVDVLAGDDDISVINGDYDEEDYM